jgi:RNA-binding protein YlmH
MFDLPVLITETENGFRLAVMVNEDVVISRSLSRADLEQLKVRINAALGDEGRSFADWDT